MTFQEELEELLKKHSIEKQSDTPDFILAEYMASCLRTYGRAIQARTEHLKEKHAQ